MYRTSEEQVFARIERIRQRAARLVHGDAAAPVMEDISDPEREALAIASRVELRLPALVATFELPPLAAEVIVCLLAAEYDPFVRTLMRAVQREMGRPWLELGTVADLLELAPQRVPEMAQLFASHGGLRRWALVSLDDSGGADNPAVVAKAKLSSRIAQHLVGDDQLPDGMRLVRPQALVMGEPTLLSQSLVGEPAAQALVARVRRALLASDALVVEVVGAPGTGKRFLTEGLASELGLSVLFADLGGTEKRLLEERLAEVKREARLTNSLPCLVQWDTHLPSTGVAQDEMSGQPPSSGPRRLPLSLIKFLEENRGVVVVTGEEREPLLELHARSITHIAVPFPTPSQRAALLEKTLLTHGAHLPPDVDFTAVARRFALDPGRIQVAARAAVELALERDVEERLEVTRGEIVEACRHQLRHDLKSLAVRVTASHKWEDLVIPVDVYHSLREMVSYIRHAAQVYDVWGFGARHSLAQGVSALFSGPPGTGKTMCASVMARELDMELFRVDLSRVVSKWIGETEKNLGKVFDEAQRSNAIILFDEADSLFAKRTDVKSSVDRYANLEVNFLLQRMEAFTGVTILTTNFEDTLDTAFKRRLTFRMRFEKPDGEARAALWRKVFPSEAALAPDIDPDKLGEAYEMSGGNIRNAAVRAAFLSAAEQRPIDQATCMLAAERESREMGLLTRTQGQAAEGASAEDEGDEPPPPKTPPRLVPITRPRTR